MYTAPKAPHRGSKHDKTIVHDVLIRFYIDT